MSAAAETQLYPAWREGIRRFLENEFKPGDIIEHAWFYGAFGLDMPQPATPLKEAERVKLQFLAAFEEMRTVLLTDHEIALASVRGVGYRVVPPAQQTRWAEGEGVADVKHAMLKMRDRLSHVNMTQLDAAARQENADALARLAMMSGMLKRVEKTKIGALE